MLFVVYWHSSLLCEIGRTCSRGTIYAWIILYHLSPRTALSLHNYRDGLIGEHYIMLINSKSFIAISNQRISYSTPEMMHFLPILVLRASKIRLRILQNS